jgi:hypothetical protein
VEYVRQTEFTERVGNSADYAPVIEFGWHFANLPWNLNFWAYYDYASGNNNPTGNVDRTFNQLVRAGHTYFGYLDLFGRQNIEDLKFRFSANPQPWLTLLAQYHMFRLASSKDALYNAAGTAIRSDPTGNQATMRATNWICS